jgi:HlyD family secretion protein
MLKFRLNFIVISITAGVFIFSCISKNNNKISASGTIEIIETNVSSKNNDEVKLLFVSEGDNVKEGQVIAEINHSILDLQLIQAKSNYQNAEINLKRVQELFASGNIPLKDKDDAENRYTVAKSSYEIIKKQIEDCSIKAPMNGIITNKYAEKGEFVTVGSPIYSISKTDPVNLTIYITEIELGKVKTGMIAKIKIDSFPKRIFPGKVIYISPDAEFTPKNIQTKDERVKQVYGVKIELSNPEGILKPGMPADAVIE